MSFETPGKPGNDISPSDEFRRLHPTSLLFDITSHVRTLIIPTVLAIASAASGSGPGAFVAGIIFLLTLLRSAVRYYSLRYQIRNRDLVVTEGIFFRRIRTVPVTRIQNVDLIQNVLHRVFGVAEVRVETASGTEPEATLRVLGLQDVELLRTEIFGSRERLQSDVSVDIDEATISGTANRESLLTIPTNLLIRAGLASNRGTLLLGVLAGVFFQFDETVEDILDIGSVATALADQTTAIGFYLVVTAFIAAILALFRLLGTVWYLLRFYGYQLTRSGDDLRIQCGLLTKVSATIPRKRIQFISIHQNLIMRWMKLAAIRIETAGGASNDDAARSVSSRWFVPVLPESAITELLEHLRPGLNWEPDNFDWQPISNRAAARMSRLAVFASIAIGVVGFAVTRPWGWTAGVVALPVLILIAIRKAKSKRYARNADSVVFRSGIFTKKTSMTFFEKIQTVRIDETPFDRRWQMATLCIDTAAAGPAEHRIHIKYLTREFAQHEFAAVASKASGHQPVFG